MTNRRWLVKFSGLGGVGFQGNDGGSPTARFRGGVGERFDRGVGRKEFLNGMALDADPTPVN